VDEDQQRITIRAVINTYRDPKEYWIK
jgi:hypothetical protein